MSFTVHITPENKSVFNETANRVETNLNNMNRNQRVSSVGLPILQAVQSATLVALIADVIQLRLDLGLGWFVPQPGIGLFMLASAAAFCAWIALSMVATELFKRPVEQHPFKITAQEQQPVPVEQLITV